MPDSIQFHRFCTCLVKYDGLLVRRVAIGRKTTQNVMREAASPAKTTVNVNPAASAVASRSSAARPRRRPAVDQPIPSSHEPEQTNQPLRRYVYSIFGWTCHSPHYVLSGFVTGGHPPHEKAVVFYETCAKTMKLDRIRHYKYSGFGNIGLTKIVIRWCLTLQKW